MASLEKGINGDDQGEHVNPAGTAGDFTDMEAEMKREKFRAKLNFTRFKNKLLFLIELPGRQEIQDACSRMDDSMECAMDAMTKLSELYTNYKEKEKNNKVVFEMKKLDDEFSTTYAAARQYFRMRKRNHRVTLQKYFLSTC